MAWDAFDRIRAGDPQPQTLSLSKFGLDESIFDLSHSSPSQQDANMTLGGLLSPIEEESGFAIENAPLQVKVTVRFLDPAVKSSHYYRTYSSSPLFEPTDRVCRGLLQRIEHCSEELITRTDPEALNARLRRAPRFEINFQLRRHGSSGIWADRAFKSYQKHTITSTLAKDIIYSTHSIVCVFLRHHDKHFQWTNDPSHEHDKPTVFKPSLTGAPDLSCVPHSRFIEPTQALETVPGYTIELVFKSRNPARRQSHITRTLKVNSKQTAPLNLGQGETLLWQAYRTLEDRLDSKRTAFEIEHAGCDGFEGVLDCDCQHFDEDALCVELCIVNNLGPYYEHLHRDIQSRLQLFRHVCGNDCDEFMHDVHNSFDRLRDKMDEKLEALNDFDFRIAELVGHGWRVKNPARFTLDNKQRLNRRTIEALLDRIRTGVGHVLRGHDVAIRMIAHKRGHLILDKALIARNHQSMPGPFTPTTPEDEQALFVAHLKARIQADIDLICKDTCSLEDVSGESFPEHSGRPNSPPSRPFTPRSTCSDGLVLPKGRRDRVDSQHTATSHTPPGSPGHFTQPPVLPCIPPRSSSMRVFPLVPAKYKEREEEPRNPTPSEPDSAIAVDFDSDRSVPDGAVSVASSTSGRARTVSKKDHREDAARGEVSIVLSPAAEVFNRSEAEVDDWSSSRSTCSSVPALTESEMATPEHSVLITPAQMRHSSPESEGLPFFNEFGYAEPSSPSVMATPDLAHTVYPAPKPSAEQKATVPKTPVIPAARPSDLLVEKAPATIFSTPGQESVGTPNCPGAGPTLEDQAHSQQPCEEDASSEIHGVVESTSHEETGSGLCIIDDSDLAGHSFDRSECESSETARHDLQHEGWLLHCVEDVDEQDDGIPEDVEYSSILASVAECDSSDTLRTQIRVLDGVIDEQDPPAPESTFVSEEEPKEQLAKNSQEAAAPLIVHKDHVELRALSGTPKTAWLESSDDASADTAQTREMSAEDELSRSKVDYFEADEDETDYEESQVHIGRVTTFSDSEIGISQCPETAEEPESGNKPQVLSLIDETVVRSLPDVSHSVVQQSPSGKTDSIAISRPFGSKVVRSGVQNGPSIISLDLNARNESLQGTGGVMVSDHLATSTPKAPTNGVFTGKPLTEKTPTQDNFTLGTTTLDLPKHDASRTFAQTQPTIAHVGLKNNFLLPSLPVFSSLDSNLNQSRSSFQSSSSEWEDCVSEARQSSDSVDTIQQPPSVSEEDVGAPERPGSPKRLGTPTAGILGLHESRWADFGIRGALTGSHAFDNRPSTAPMLSLDHSGEERTEPGDDNAGEDSEETPRARPVSPHRKSLHLLHKKSISSIIFPGMHHGHQPHQYGKPPKLNKKESKELRAREKEKAKAKAKAKENSKPGVAPAPYAEDAGDVGRFPRAMMLVAGLAIASSVVNRTSG